MGAPPTSSEPLSLRTTAKLHVRTAASSETGILSWQAELRNLIGAAGAFDVAYGPELTLKLVQANFPKLSIEEATTKLNELLEAARPINTRLYNIVFSSLDLSGV